MKIADFLKKCWFKSRCFLISSSLVVRLITWSPITIWSCQGSYIVLSCFHYTLFCLASIIIYDNEKFWAQILSTREYSYRFIITSHLIATQTTCPWFMHNFEEHKLATCSYQEFRENTFDLLSMLLYSLCKCPTFNCNKVKVWHFSSFKCKIKYAVRTQWLSEKFWKKNFFGHSHSFWKDLFREYFVVSKFWLEVPKFKENVIISVINLIEVRDLLFTLLQVITILVTHFQKFMNTNYSYW